VNGDAIRTKALHIYSNFNNIWIVTSPAIAKRGNFINVYRKLSRHEANLRRSYVQYKYEKPQEMLIRFITVSILVSKQFIIDNKIF
jgi:hypothetical protein